MCFLTLVTHLLPILALGGLVRGEDIPSESLHRSHNDEVYDLSEELVGNNHSNLANLIFDPSKSQSTTVSSIPISAGQLSLSLPIGKERSYSTVDENLIATPKETDNVDEVRKKQLHDDTENNDSDETTEVAGKSSETTEFFPLTLETSNIARNLKNRADLGTAITANDPNPQGEKNFVHDDDVLPSSPPPRFNDEFESADGKIKPNVEINKEPISDSISEMDQLAEKNPVLSTDDMSTHKESIGNRNLKANEATRSDSQLSEQINPNSGDSETAGGKDHSEDNSPPDQYLKILNDGDAADDKQPGKALRDVELSATSARNSNNETSDNWLSVLQSIVPSQKERLDFNEKMLQSIQNTVSNTNVNHNVMNNAPTVPCTHSSQPAPSHPYWPSSSIPMRQLPPDMPVEYDIPEKYTDFEIEPESSYIDYANNKRYNVYSSNEFVNPLVGWAGQPAETQYMPIIHIKGEITIRGQSQPMRRTRKCRKVLAKSERICRKGKPICHTPWSGCKPICKPGKMICSQYPSQRLRVKLVCKEISIPIPWPRIIYPAPSYETSDYELFDEQASSLRESEHDLSMSESDECEHEISEILPSAELLEEVLEPLSKIEDIVPEDEEDSGVSEQVFEEAIRNAISEAPEILAPEPIADLETEIVQELERVPVTSTADKPLRVEDPLQNLVETEAPVSNVDEIKAADDEIGKLLPLTSPTAVIEGVTKPLDGSEKTIDFGNGNANHNMNTNVNLNENLNLNGNVVAQVPVLPDIQVPRISPLIKPQTHPGQGKDSKNLNNNANVNMNLNINHNTNANSNHNVRLPVQPIVEPKLERVTTIPQAEPTMPTFENKAPSQSGLDITEANQNANINMNSNTNINQNRNVNNQIKIPLEPEINIPGAKITPQDQQPTVPQPNFKVKPESVIQSVQQNVNTNVNNNVNINHNSNVHKPQMPHVKVPEDAVVDRNPIMLPDVVLPSIKQENQNGNVNANVNVNVNSNMNKNINENREPVTSKVAKNVPITIPEPVQVAEPPVEVSAPVYDVPLLPAPSSSSLNINSNVNHNLNSNVNFNIINERNKNVTQQPLPAPINQSTPAPTSTEATPELILVPDVSDSTDTTIRGNENVNENLNSNLNINSNQNFNEDTMNQATQILPGILPVIPETVPTQITPSLPVVNESSNIDSNTNHNVNSNVNINSNHNSAVNVPEATNPGAPVMIPESRPVAVMPQFTFPEIVPVAPVSPQVSHNHNVNSNVNYNSNINNNVNHKIVGPSEQPVSTVIKPVESQPVAVPEYSEISPLNPVQTEINENLNENASVNKNANVNTNVNTNHNLNINAGRNVDVKETRKEPLEMAEESIVTPKLTDPVVTQIPKLEMNGNSNTPEPGKIIDSEPIENTELKKNQNTDANLNYNSNVNINHNSNLNENNNIEHQGVSLLPSPPILLPPQAQASIFPSAPIVESGVLRNANSNANYNANVDVNHNSNSNANFNQNNQMRGQEPILLPPLVPWIQEPALQHQIPPSSPLNLVHNANVNLNQNSNTNVNHNVNLNQNHNIVPRVPSALPVTENHFNKNNYPPIFEPDVRQPVMIAAPTSVIEEKKASIPQVTRNSQVNVNQNSNVNMNYNSNYNNNANYNGKADTNENGNGKLPLIKPLENVLTPVIVPQSLDRGTEPWNLQKNSNVNANYNSNMNYNANVNANSNYNSNLGQSGLGILARDAGGTHEINPGIQSPTFNGNPALSAPIIPNTLIGANVSPVQTGYGTQQNTNTNANYNSNSNYNANYNHNANYNAQLANDQKNSKRKGWYELWYNNGEERDGWTEIWNNKEFKRFLEQQLKDMKQQENIQAQARAQAPARAQAQAQAFAIAR